METRELQAEFSGNETELEKHIILVLNRTMFRQSVYDAFEALPAPKKSFQAFLIDQLDLCVEELARAKHVAARDQKGNCILLGVQRLSGPDDPGPSYSVFYEDSETGRITSLDYPLSVFLGARLNQDRSGVCIPEAVQEFPALVIEKFNSVFSQGKHSTADRFVLNWL